MKILCIEKSEKINTIKKIFNIVSLNKNKIIIYSELLKFRDKIKVTKKIKKILLKEKVNKIILSMNLKYDKEFVSLLISNNINIPKERWLFKMLTNEVINQIVLLEDRPKTEIWITVNDIDNITKNIILKFAKEFKRVNIVTNHIGKFKKIEEELYEEGIMMTITNNKRKSLLKATLILNVDFPKEILNQFTIFDHATIINLEEKVNIKKKRFCGKIINDIKIECYKDSYIEELVRENNLINYDIKDICNVLNVIPEKIKFSFE